MNDKTPTFEEIFHAALEIDSPEKRKEFLQANCGDDSELLSELREMLSSHQNLGSFLDKPPEDVQATIIGQSEKDLAASMEAGLAPAFNPDAAVIMGDAGHSVLKSLGQSVDVPRVVLRESAEDDDPVTRPSSSEIPQSASDSRYQLQGEIARGGMGAIIKGRDNDLGRDLAIKVLLDSHKDKPEVIQRFVEEAQIGGQLQHPGIAPIYELGQFRDKRPFFAMKLVKGQTLSKLLADREDAANERGKFIGIFEQICQTMAYAHSRGVIHRDLKPANIMVGAFGEVQVMDWGLAKVLSSGGVADEKTSHTKHKDASIIQTMRSIAGSDTPGTLDALGSQTQMGSVMGTPAYMPPEQALGEIDQMNERADVFGLGAILCEILTDKPPYVADDGTRVFRMASRGKLEDAFSRLQACGADAELITLAKDCLAVEPADRPRDASVLAERVTAYLESVESKLRETELAKVDAQVRAEELRRRQRLAYTAGTAIVATLVIGISVSLWQMVRATNAEQLARDEANRATAAEKRTAETLVEVAAERDAKELARRDAADISTFLTDILQSPDPTRDGREIKVVELLDNAAKRLETDLAEQPAQRARLQETLAGTYRALGLYRQAIPLQEQVLTLSRQLLGPEHPDTLRAMSNLAAFYRYAGRGDEALPLKEEVLTLMRQVNGPEHPDTLRAMGSLANSYHDAGRRDEALPLAEQVLTLRRQLLGPDHPDTLTAMTNLAVSYRDSGRRDEALPLREEVLTLRRQLLGPEHPATLRAMNNLAVSYRDAGRPDEAIPLQEQVLTLSRQLLGPEHPDTLGAMGSLAISYHAAGRRDEALPLREKVLTLSRQVNGPEHPSTLMAMHNLANSYNDAGRLDEALPLQEEMLTLRRQVLGPEHPDTLDAIHNLAIYYSDAGRGDEALPLQEEVLTLRRQVNGPEHPATHSAMGNLANSYRDAGRLDEALPLQEEMLTLRRQVLGPEHPNTLRAMHNLASFYYDAGRRDEALPLREKVLTLSRQVNGPEHPSTLMAMHNLANSYNDLGFELEPQGKKDEAIDAWQKALELNPNLKTNAPYSLGVLLEGAGNFSAAFTAYLRAIKTGVMRAQAIEKAQRILEDPENLEACLQAVKSKPNLALLGFKAFAAVGQTKDALSLLVEFSVTKPEETMLAMEAAALQAWFGQADEYTVFRQRTLAWATDTEDSATAERVAKLACLLPIQDASMQTAVLTLARQAVELGKDDKEFLPWAYMALGMAEYRNGQFEQAITSLTTAAEKGSTEVSGTAKFYRVMCLFQQDQKAEAQTLFAATEKTMRSLPADENNPLTGNANHDDLILWLAYKEARAMLNEPGKPETPDK